MNDSQSLHVLMRMPNFLIIITSRKVILRTPPLVSLPIDTPPWPAHITLTTETFSDGIPTCIPATSSPLLIATAYKRMGWKFHFQSQPFQFPKVDPGHQARIRRSRTDPGRWV